jgi:aromatic ring-opening dioxygenase catalytic subunit (LigB family)
VLPTYYLPHGGGPWPFMEERIPVYAPLAAFLRGFLADVAETPRAIVVISGHWEEPVPTVSSRRDYSMFYDYYGFPEHTYALQYPAPGSPEVAARVTELLQTAGIPVAVEHERGYDHGVFVPLMVALPDATIPIVPLSLIEGLDAEAHIALGRALAPLRNEDVVIAGSGQSFHNARARYFGGPETLDRSQRFDAWLNDAVTGDPARRDQELARWYAAPEAQFCHPREEHLIPLMVAAGAAEGAPATRIFNESLTGAAVSGFRFG